MDMFNNNRSHSNDVSAHFSALKNVCNSTICLFKFFEIMLTNFREPSNDMIQFLSNSISMLNDFKTNFNAEIDAFLSILTLPKSTQKDADELLYQMSHIVSLQLKYFSENSNIFSQLASYLKSDLIKTNCTLDTNKYSIITSLNEETKRQEKSKQHLESPRRMHKRIYQFLSRNLVPKSNSASAASSQSSFYVPLDLKKNNNSDVPLPKEASMHSLSCSLPSIHIPDVEMVESSNLLSTSASAKLSTNENSSNISHPPDNVKFTMIKQENSHTVSQEELESVLDLLTVNTGKKLPRTSMLADSSFIISPKSSIFGAKSAESVILEASSQLEHTAPSRHGLVEQTTQSELNLFSNQTQAFDLSNVGLSQNSEMDFKHYVAGVLRNQAFRKQNLSAKNSCSSNVATNVSNCAVMNRHLNRNDTMSGSDTSGSDTDISNESSEKSSVTESSPYYCLNGISEPQTISDYVFYPPDQIHRRRHSSGDAGLEDSKVYPLHFASHNNNMNLQLSSDLNYMQKYPLYSSVMPFGFNISSVYGLNDYGYSSSFQMKDISRLLSTI